ncbi:MAG: hypothetical protein R2865_03000 [Deinococcales bacterium]
MAIYRLCGDPLFAGLKTIPKELYHAAAIDGANPWQQFWRIHLTLVRPVTVLFWSPLLSAHSGV